MAFRVLIAPDKFKGSLTAPEAAEAIARGLRKTNPAIDLVLRPIADGGEGTAEALVSALGGTWITLPAADPLGRLVEARYAWLPGAATVIDMSEASGLWRVSQDKRDILRSTTAGTGQLLADAVRRGARRVFVGLGGSATNDGGLGLASALGYTFRDGQGNILAPLPVNLPTLARIDEPSAPLNVPVIGLCDVRNPLVGPRGAAFTYGPQKGATPLQCRQLDEYLRHLAAVVKESLGTDFSEHAGAGAAGGLGFGLMSFCSASLQPGFETLATLLQLEKEVSSCDLVITGEGRVDAQTLEGKGPGGVAALARRTGRPVIAFAGAVTDLHEVEALFDRLLCITPTGFPSEQAFAQAAQLLTDCAEQLRVAPQA